MRLFSRIAETRRSTYEIAGFMAWIAVGLTGLLSAASSIVPVASMPEPWMLFALGWSLFAVNAWGIPRRWAEYGHHLLGLSILTMLGLTMLPPSILRGFELNPWGNNEAAGSLLLFLPLWLAQTCASGLNKSRSVFVLMTLWALIVLTALASRGASVAAVIALVVTVAIGSKISRRALTQLASGFVAGVVIVGVLAPDALTRLIHGFLLEGQAKGFTWSHSLSGRPDIWWRSSVAWMDLPWGVGLASIPQTLAEVYATSASANDPEHAHQQILQLGLELGWFGLSAIVALWMVCVLRLRRAISTSDRNSGDRWRHVGLAGAFVGYQIFGLVDCLPLGNGSSLGSWTLLALMASSPTSTTALKSVEPFGRAVPPIAPQTAPRIAPQIAPRIVSRVVSSVVGSRSLSKGAMALALMVAVIGLGSIGISWISTTDRAHRPAIRALVANDSPSLLAITGALEAQGPATDGTLWLLGLSYEHLRETDRRNGAWRRLLNRSSHRIRLLQAHPSGDSEADLARFATERHPNSCSAWWWRALSSIHENQADAIRDFRRGLVLCPKDGDAWLRLGDLLYASNDLRPSLEAFAQACAHGDPGANGCRRAGNLAAALGEQERARHLFSQSRLPQAQRQAQALTTRSSSLR